MPVDVALTDLTGQFSRIVTESGVAFPRRAVALAVSGGGDSIAMMHMAARMISPEMLHVVSVDHGLRSGAATEIAVVSDQAAQLGLAHHVLHWTWDKTGNLQAAARHGRWQAIARWAKGAGIDAVFLGHTEDDQVETLLMRLARGSGVDGLTAMNQTAMRDGLQIVRPLLGMTRAHLRAWLKDQNIRWCDDPSNEDRRFDRVRARQMYTQLEALGMTRKRLLQTVDHMQAAHRSLQKTAFDFARRHVRQDAGDLIFDPEGVILDKDDTPRRVMAAAFSWMAGQTYRPRFDSLMARVDQVRKGQKVTLSGCILLPQPGGGARLVREAAATPVVIAGQSPDAGVQWDRRWYLEGPMTPGLRFAALGDGLRQCTDWRRLDIPQSSLMASPAVWRDGALLAAPVAGLSNGWSAQIVTDFHSAAFGIED